MAGYTYWDDVYLGDDVYDLESEFFDGSDNWWEEFVYEMSPGESLGDSGREEGPEELDLCTEGGGDGDDDLPVTEGLERGVSGEGCSLGVVEGGGGYMCKRIASF